MKSDNAGNLARLVVDVEQVASDTRATFGQLTPEQINWKPSDKQWSVGQCFDHLIVTNRMIFPTLKKIIKGEKKKRLYERMPLLPSLFGRLFIKAVQPESTRRFKAPKIFKPSSSQISSTVVEDFVNQQKRVVKYMRATEGLDLQSIVVTSPVSKLVIYNLLDAYTIIVTHERRHFMQAKRVMEAEGFPKE